MRAQIFIYFTHLVPSIDLSVEPIFLLKLLSFRFFGLFQTNITIFTTRNVKNVHPVYNVGIRTHDPQTVSLIT